MAEYYECPICYDIYENDAKVINCGHTFCKICVDKINYCSICGKKKKRVSNNYSLQSLVDENKKTSIICTKGTRLWIINELENRETDDKLTIRCIIGDDKKLDFVKYFTKTKTNTCIYMKMLTKEMIKIKILKCDLTDSDVIIEGKKN